ncbi:MAG: EamA family transporter [Candidatus Cloacimonetes bacterium]|nr:EamA family transporter [Candidatus Cloacimonadota bacterium]
MNWLIMMASVAIGSLAQIPLKKSAQKTSSLNARYFINLYTAVGYGMMFIASILSFWAIRKLGIQLAAMIETTGYIYIMLIGYFVFKEKITLRKLFACALIICGIIIYTG